LPLPYKCAVAYLLLVSISEVSEEG
jgi:hypothetical protein